MPAEVLFSQKLIPSKSISTEGNRVQFAPPLSFLFIKAEFFLKQYVAYLIKAEAAAK